MNSLSWLLYLGDVIPNIAFIFWIFGIGFMVICIFMLILIPVSEFEILDPVKGVKSFWKLFWSLLPAAIVMLTIASFSPSKSTMYAIALSEFGEKIVMTEGVQDITSDATKALRSWIKKQIEPEKKGQ